MSLIGFRYIEASDPGAVGAGYQWYNTTNGALYERDTNNNAWVSVGNANSVNYGHLSINGGTMSGAIAGVTGWAPVSAPNFTSEAKLNGVNLATVNDLAALQTSLEAMISSLVASEIASSSSTVSIANNLVVSCGSLPEGSTYDTVFVLPAPIFADGIQATPAQCFSIIVPGSNENTGGNGLNEFFTEMQGGNPLQWKAYFQALNVSWRKTSINYIIIAVR